MGGFPDRTDKVTDTETKKTKAEAAHCAGDALFIKIALVDATLAAKRLYLRFAHRKQGIERLEKSVRNGLHRSIHFASSYDFILILVNIVQ